MNYPDYTRILTDENGDRWIREEDLPSILKCENAKLREVLESITRVSGRLAVADCRKWAKEALQSVDASKEKS